jgi:hypothetical protein
LLARALHVDGRRLAGDRDRLLESADLHFCVDRRSKRPGQLDAFALDRAEPGQGEGHFVRTGPEVDDPILAGAVAYDRSASFDQGWADGLDVDAWQDGP